MSQDSPGRAPLFSVITVTFNAEALVEATARSLREQRFKDYEWVVVDGASRDRTVEKVRAAEIGPLRVLSEPDRGIYDAMNKAVGLAQGRWIYFLNAGDAFADADVLGDVARALALNPDVELLWGDMRYVGQGRDDMVRFAHVSRLMLVFEDLNHQATFARRTLFQAVGSFNLNFPTSADYDWFLRAFRKPAVTRYVPRVIGRFEVGGAHARDLEKLAAERKRLRLQYVAPMLLSLGVQWARVRRRLRLRAAVSGKQG